ncbi:hypothetical protein [Tortoise microvirus 111]|nr:hypothetical protein [Tortoise microvirus 9]QCS37508.1 hypothetical protein [Tortoise microvirus 111]QPB07332.1 MAG: hypothetical protein [Microvirus sp.]
MKYRRPDYLEKQSFEGTLYSPYEPEYVLNEETEELEIVGQINVQEQIQSHAGCALDKIFERFLGDIPQNNPVSTPVDGVYDTTQRITDLAELGKICDIAEGYRRNNNLSAELSISQIFDLISRQEKSIAAYIAAQTKKGDNNNENEKKTVAEGEQETIPTDGE